MWKAGEPLYVCRKGGKRTWIKWIGEGRARDKYRKEMGFDKYYETTGLIFHLLLRLLCFSTQE